MLLLWEVMRMWRIKYNGELAENDDGAVLRLDLGTDNLVRVKRNYKTVAVCKSASEGRDTIAKLVEQWNGGHKNEID